MFLDYKGEFSKKCINDLHNLSHMHGECISKNSINFSDLFGKEPKNINIKIEKFANILSGIHEMFTTCENLDSLFPEHPCKELIELLLQIKDSFQSLPHDMYPPINNSFFRFISLVSSKYFDNNLLMEAIFFIIRNLSMLEFNPGLIPIFQNYSIFLNSSRSTIQSYFLSSTRNYLLDEPFFMIFTNSDLLPDIINILNTSGNVDILKIIFDLFSVYINQCFSFLEDEKIQIDLIFPNLQLILETTMIYLSSCERTELLPSIFCVVSLLFPRNDLNNLHESINTIKKTLLDIAKNNKNYNIEKLFQNFLENNNPEIFLASAKLFHDFWPDSKLFNETLFYQKYKNIIEDDSFAFAGIFVERNIGNHDDIVVVSIGLLTMLISDHYLQIKENSFLQFLLDMVEKCSFSVKKYICKFLTAFLTYSTVNDRRELTNELTINLLIDTIESHEIDNILDIATTLILMKNDDPDFWNEIIEVNNIRTILEEIVLNDEDKNLTLLVQGLLTL
ncbi:hypothetical protein TRFO_20888 [Tritrichomonas foetus]|uniref:Uncharacterized protein n=1 Tax=Tritrichomonas foetus TaxID=1144522 RepID=A0A1J4KL07_9EUKA|nr:hypothetical protein TRFO_20888 [Tritrichomonas foetus]|eukprot:OHT10061.1 hypothetical protein TRFO_20888 [Tritrichomonas foetus]